MSVGGSVPTALVTVGSPSITAVYEGDTNFTSSTSANLNQAVGVADLTVSMTHSGEFRQGDKNATYTITVSNVDAATSGTVTVVDTFPTSLYPPSTNNGIVNGWTVSVSGFTVTATRGDVLAAGASYPPLTLTVQVSDGAPASVTNTVTVSGGGETNAANDTASDIATVVGVPPTVLSTWPELTDGTIAVGTTAITIYYSEYVPGGGTASNYELRSAGPDGLLGTGDDVIIPVAISFSNTVAVLTTAGLPEDVYRLTVRDTLADPAGNKLDGDNDGIAGGDWVRDFVVTANDKILSSATTFNSGGSTPTSMVVSDFNGDGKLDVAVTNRGSSTVGILLGNGAGGFSGPTMFSTGGAYAFNVVSGDFNADGIPDLAVANSSSGTIGILLGKGDGSFLPVATFSSGGKLPTTIAVADFNHDGKRDLAVTNQFDNTVSILLGNGSGGFSAPTTFSPGGTGVYGLAVGDFDGNGNLDIAVTNWSTNGAVDLLMGDGAGGFSPGGEFSSGGSHPSTIVAGDFNNDGKLDLAFTNDNSYTVGIIFGDAKGSFSAPLTVNSGPGAPYCLTQGDFNRDGALDLVVANNLGTGFAANNYGSGLAVLLGDGSGGFSAAKAFDAGGIGAHAVAVGDFNGDGCSDVAVANDSSNTVGVLLNVYDRSIVTLTSPHGLPFDIAVGPFGAGELIQGYENAFDGDGRLMVGGTAFQPDTSTCSMADTGRTVVTANGTVAGLMVNREVTVPNTGSEDFARTVDTFTNSTGAPITTTVTIVGNLGSDAATRVFATSDGDTVVEATDQWIGTDDASDGSGTPAIIHYIYGPQGLQPASVSVIGDNIVWTYNVTISTGQTLQLAWFTILGTTEAAAVAAANALVTPAGFGGQASAFLDATELASLANFGWDTTPLTVTINQASGQAGVTDSAPIHFTAVFSEPVNDFTTGDVTLAGTAGATTAIVTNPSGDLMTYDVAVSNMARDGSVTVGIATGVAHDLAGNPNAASTSTINTVNYSAPSITVTTDADEVDANDGVISLREAVSYANSHGGNEQIVFAPNLAGHTIALTGGELALTDITGTTTILGANQMTVSGNNASRVFNIGSGATVEISGLTIANGYVGGVGGYGTSASGGGIFNSGTLALTDCAISACTSTGDVNADGGGIYNDGALTIANSTIAANSAAPLNCFGGGIYNAPDGSLTITESTISGNSVYAGGGIYNDGDLTITDSTISGNSVANAGGGLFNAESSTMRITDCTIANNSAVFGGGGICNEYTIVISNCTIAGNSAVDFGGGILNYGTATLSDTLMSGNSNIGSTSPDILGTVTANYSLIRNAAGVILSDSSAGNITGVDPLLGTLGDYGGPTQTMPLLPGSPAIDAGSNALAVDSHGNPLTTDQRGLGFARIVNSTVDIGAYESSWDTTPPTVTINQASGQADPTNGSPINFTVVFSELVSDFSTGDVALSGTAGATTAIVTNPSGDQVTYNVAVSGMTGDGTVIASVAAGVAHDAAGNSNDPSTSTDNTVTYDTTFPTVTIEGISIAGTGPPRGRILAFEVVFSEAVSDFTIDDVTLSGTAPGKSITSFSGSFTTYDVFVSGMTGSGTVTVSVAAGVAHDAAGNPNLASTDCTAIYNAPGYDFNDDGIADVLLQNQSTGEVGAWLLQNGAANVWKSMGTAPPSTWQVVGVGDFDGNGLSDVLLQNQTTGEVGAWLVQSGGAANGWKSMGTAPVATWQVVGVGDFDGNGLSDVLLQNQTTGEVGAWLVQSGGAPNGWKSMGTAPVATWHVVGVGDFDGNGLSDVLLQNQSTGEVGAWLLQNGAPNGWKSMGTAPVSTWKVVGVGDFDGNGLSDVLLHNQSSGEVGAWLLQSGGAPNGWKSMGTAPASTWKVVAVGDYDGNGLSDVLLQNQTTGEVGAWLLQSGSAPNGWKSMGSAPVSTWKVVPGEVAALQAASVVTDPESDVASLTQSDLRPIVAEAIARWAAAGLDASTVARLTQVHFVISDLPGSYLGEADGSLVYLDSNAAGHGWFIDPTPELDEEFAPTANPGQLRAVDPRAVDRIDLLTVVEHELGHVAGFGDLDALSDNLMSGVLGTGIRRDPQRLSVDAVLATT